MQQVRVDKNRDGNELRNEMRALRKLKEYFMELTNEEKCKRRV